MMIDDCDGGVVVVMIHDYDGVVVVVMMIDYDGGVEMVNPYHLSLRSSASFKYDHHLYDHNIIRWSFCSAGGYHQRIQ